MYVPDAELEGLPIKKVSYLFSKKASIGVKLTPGGRLSEKRFKLSEQVVVNSNIISAGIGVVAVTVKLCSLKPSRGYILPVIVHEDKVVDEPVSVSTVSLVVVEEDVPVNSPKVSSNRSSESASSVVDEEVPISVGGIILPLSSTGRSSAVFSPSKLISLPPSGISLSSVGTGSSSGSDIKTIVISVEEIIRMSFNKAKSPRIMEDELIANS